MNRRLITYNYLKTIANGTIYFHAFSYQYPGSGYLKRGFSLRESSFLFPVPLNNIWTDKDKILHGFNQLIERFKTSILVFSYRSNGIPSVNSLIGLLETYGRDNELHYSREIKYALSDTNSKEVLIVSYPH